MREVLVAILGVTHSASSLSRDLWKQYKVFIGHEYLNAGQAFQSPDQWSYSQVRFSRSNTGWFRELGQVFPPLDAAKLSVEQSNGFRFVLCWFCT